MIDSKDTLSIIHKLVQPNIKILSIVFLVIILLFKNVDINIILISGFILNVFIYHKEIITIFKDINQSETKTERVIEGNRRKKKEIHFDEEINKILRKLRKYRKYNTNAYDDGYENIKMFMCVIHDLEKLEIAHPKQYFNNAELYLKQSLNHFQSISISVPEENLNQALKYNKFEPTKLGNRVGKLCKRLHKHCYYLLYNLSLRLNESWIKEPDIYKEQIAFNYQNVEPMHTLDFNWDLY
jgi:hypothetical protein